MTWVNGRVSPMSVGVLVAKGHVRARTAGPTIIARFTVHYFRSSHSAETAPTLFDTCERVIRVGVVGTLLLQFASNDVYLGNE